MNWTHSGAGIRGLGFFWILSAILVVTDASLDVWLACGIAGISLGIATALPSVRGSNRSAVRHFKAFSFRRRIPRFYGDIVSDRFPPDQPGH
jgi:hypothetical protein